MGTVLGAKFRLFQLLGLAVVIAGMLFLIWKGTELLFDKEQQKVATRAEIESILIPRWQYEDSLHNTVQAINFDSLFKRYAVKNNIDSQLKLFYSKQQQHEKDIDAINNASNDDILKQWADRYQ